MNTLTKNRILQKGDEYLTNAGDWKKVPDCDFGMLIQFTKYTEVRRPSEQPFTEKQCKATATEGKATYDHTGPAPFPKEAITESVAATAREALKQFAGGSNPASTIVETPSPAPEPQPTAVPEAAAQTERVEKQDHAGARDLPTVISVKAHKKPERSNPAPPAIGTVVAKGIDFPKNGTKPTWRGRNGTFAGRGLILSNHPNKLITLNPVGVRGVSYNCEIQIPVSVIPQMIEWLKEHQQA